MTIAGRRQILGWGALGIGAMTLDGCDGVLPWGKAPAAPPADIHRLLAELDGVMLRLGSLDPRPERFGVRSGRPHVAEGKATCKRLLTTLCAMGTYRDVPEALWREPRVEEHLARTLPEVYATIRGARNHLAELTEDEAFTIEKRLKDDPELAMRVMERVDDYAKQIDVPLEQRTYLRTATVQLSGRYRYEGAKEVTSKLVAQYDRALAQRRGELGMMGDPDTGAGGATPESAPSRASFRTRAQAGKIYVATCGLEPKVTLDDTGAARRVVLDFEETRCQTTSPVTLSDEPPIRGVVHVEPGGDGQNVVTVALYPPPGAEWEAALTVSVASIAQGLQARLATGQAGDACVSRAECGPLHCVDGVCQTPPQPPARPSLRSAPPRLGSEGESCRSAEDCEGGLACKGGSCQEEVRSRSAKLKATTRKVAIVGAYTLIPPICAIGVLILLQCLFMIIVTGVLYAGGD
jgi:hypothetical protein